MPNCSTTADSNTAPMQKNPTVERPPSARNAPPKAAPPTPPIWLLAPNIPTAVAWELPEISVLIAKNVGHPTLINVILTRATPTVPQADKSKENRNRDANPPPRRRQPLPGPFVLKLQPTLR